MTVRMLPSYISKKNNMNIRQRVEKEAQHCEDKNVNHKKLKKNLVLLTRLRIR